MLMKLNGHFHVTNIIIIILVVKMCDNLQLYLCDNKNVSSLCVNGNCVNKSCVCHPGWGGQNCDQCNGRISLDRESGLIYVNIGSFYPKDFMCSWLLDTHSNNGGVIVEFIFHEFETECGWDHFYIHDGDSVFSPRKTAFSGLVADLSNRKYEFVIRFSGRYGYLHFFSDAAYTLRGFQISYSMKQNQNIPACLLSCSLVDDKCDCYVDTADDGCDGDIRMCSGSCLSGGTCQHGLCGCSTLKEEITSLSTDWTHTMWRSQSTIQSPAGCASHQAILLGGVMWVMGGCSLDHTVKNGIAKYILDSGVWTTIAENFESPSNPWPLYAHSAAMFENFVYVHGGQRGSVANDELWRLDIRSMVWIQLSSSGCLVSGHTAHMVNGSMLVIFGYSHAFGYLNRIQRYDVAQDSWHMVGTSGSLVLGVYGHASALDPVSDRIYVLGGYHSYTLSGSLASYAPSDKLYVLETSTFHWTMLASSGHPAYLHTVVVSGRYLFMFGGKTNADSSKIHRSKCSLSSFMLYDIECNSWHSLSRSFMKKFARFGHSMVLYKDELFLFGGFNNLMLNDVVAISIDVCPYMSSEHRCAMDLPASNCVWEETSGTCRSNSSEGSFEIGGCQAVDDDDDIGDQSNCSFLTDCHSCLSGQAACNWCDGICTLLDCPTHTPAITNLDECPSGESQTGGCALFQDCQMCLYDNRCVWTTGACKQRSSVDEGSNVTEIGGCGGISCVSHNSCLDCTRDMCMWCSLPQMCIDRDSYVPVFPYGQCLRWTVRSSVCPDLQCQGQPSCHSCLSNSICGWCNGLENNGLGVCMNGGLAGPVLPVSDLNGASVVSSQSWMCSAERWHFVQCPACQCNGHSTCAANTSKCLSCAFPTIGSRCDTCRPLFYGQPANHGTCSECQCHGQAISCDPLDGTCHCGTRGIVGHHCEWCDTAHQYFGDPKDGGTCYYHLSTDYQYTFNLSKLEDENYTQINFLSIPLATDRDVDFTVNCSDFALLNITFRSRNQPMERPISSVHMCDYFRTKFEHKAFSLGSESNGTFLIYIYDFRTPFWLKISFSQFPKIDLVHFFITFFSCFLSLMVISAMLWKMKHKYNSFRQRQRLMLEMQQMARRPFSHVNVELDGCLDVEMELGKREAKGCSADYSLRHRGKVTSRPSAIAVEPLLCGKAAVLSLLVQLPFDYDGLAPSGHSGLVIGSALVTMSTARKQSLDHIKPDRQKSRKGVKADTAC